MLLNISTYSQVPIYEQIKAQLKECILNGTLQANEQLPSIRMLAAQLNVGIITVKRAYEDLEKEHYLYNRQGKGCFVRPFDEAQVKQEHRQQIRNKLRALLSHSKEFAIEKEEILTMVEEEWRKLHDGCNQG